MAALDPSRYAALPLWIAALAALAAIIGWETDWGRRVTPSHEVPAAPAQPVNVALLPEFPQAAPAEARRETVERPAFVPTRRPAPPPPSASAEPPRPRLQRGQFVLTGTAVVDTGAIAFLREASSGKSRTVRKGDNVNGMTVTEIVPDRVMLALGDETEGIALRVAPGPRATVQPAAPAAAPPPPAAAAPAPAAPAPPPAGVPAAATPPPAEAQGPSLIERRRAARAAQAAAEAAAAARGEAPPAPPSTAIVNGQPIDPAWAETYRRMGQRPK